MNMEHTIPGRAALKQNLLDAGCDKEKTRQILQLWEEGRVTELLQLLRCQRCHLMEALHREQQKVDCLDYLIYQLKCCNCGEKR